MLPNGSWNGNKLLLRKHSATGLPPHLCLLLACPSLLSSAKTLPCHNFQHKKQACMSVWPCMLAFIKSLSTIQYLHVLDLHGSLWHAFVCVQSMLFSTSFK